MSLASWDAINGINHKQQEYEHHTFSIGLTHLLTGRSVRCNPPGLLAAGLATQRRFIGSIFRPLENLLLLCCAHVGPEGTYNLFLASQKRYKKVRFEGKKGLPTVTVVVAVQF